MSENFQTIREQIVNILTKAFEPSELEVIDDSHRHIGHAGHNGKGESHFKVKIVSDRFQGLSRLQRHQLVYSELAHIMPIIHALNVSAKTASE